MLDLFAISNNYIDNEYYILKQKKTGRSDII